MKRDPVREALQALAEAARRPHDGEALALIRTALGHRSSHVVARAARAAREAQHTALGPDLSAAFPRFLEDPIRRDPGCTAKTEIVHALRAFGHPAPDVYLRGVAHVQREPAFGPPIDTAAELRALSAMALVETGHPAGLTTSVGLLVDPEPAARAGALRALAACGRPDVALLMRLFVLRGDPEPGVLADAFDGVLALDPHEGTAFVAERLAAGDVDVARAAALALGEARHLEAVAVLRARLPADDRPEVRHAIIAGLATTRHDEAFAALLDLIASGAPADSNAAVQALGIFPRDEHLQRRVAAALARRHPAPARRPRPARRHPDHTARRMS